MLNTNYFRERKLLKRCFEDDSSAQREFAALSYLNTIHRCVHDENTRYNRPLNEAELDSVFTLIVTEIYSAHEVLPSWTTSLYARVTAYAANATLRAIRQSTTGETTAP